MITLALPAVCLTLTIHPPGVWFTIAHLINKSRFETRQPMHRAPEKMECKFFTPDLILSRRGKSWQHRTGSGNDFYCTKKACRRVCTRIFCIFRGLFFRSFRTAVVVMRCTIIRISWEPRHTVKRTEPNNWDKKMSMSIIVHIHTIFIIFYSAVSSLKFLSSSISLAIFLFRLSL